ncbi:membrane lipoprotein lipid attachment site [mine drainage metagenome]|uniref:Membrane lipoprotein lipid attachment site n=1 Tax=mine drainage metagenome TaxID=410659 RepID=T1D6P6_9ZZZZ
MIRIIQLSLSILVIAGLAGCATVGPACPLQKGPGCQSVTQVYQDAIEADPNLSGQWLPKVSAQSEPAAGPDWSAPAGYAEPGQVGEPIFREPRVYRVWIAPFVDANGNMHSGQYVYFSTPGEWSYGSLQDTGVASPGLYGPRPPGDSFGGKRRKATALNVPRGQPPKPSSGNKNTTVNGITQPKESLTP